MKDYFLQQYCFFMAFLAFGMNFHNIVLNNSFSTGNLLFGIIPGFIFEPDPRSILKKIQ